MLNDSDVRNTADELYSASHTEKSKSSHFFAKEIGQRLLS